MSTFSIPNSQGLIRQIPNSETAGELWETFGMDLSMGKLKASNKLLKVKDGDDDGNFGILYALFTYGSYHYAITGGVTKEMYRCGVLDDVTVGSNWLKDNSNGVFGEETDVTYFNSLMLVSQDTDIMSYDGSTEDVDYWTTISLGGETGPALTSGVPHMLHTHRGGAETLFVTNGNKVHYANTASGHSTITLGADQVISCIDSGVSAIWAGSYSESPVQGYVYEIYIGQTSDDSTPIANQAYEVEGNVLALKVLNNIPHVVTDRGHIQAFNGAGFTTVASFPFAYTSESLEGVRSGAINDNSINRPVHPRGVRAHNDSLFININTEMYNEDKVPQRSKSGVWEYDSKTGNLTHRYAFAETSSDNGQPLADRSGAILIVDNKESFLLAGATMKDKTNGLYAENKDAAGFGYFVTTELSSGTVTDAYENAYVKAKTLTGSENIRLKFRLRKQDPSQGAVTFANATTINTTDTVTVAAGDEATFMDNTHAGVIAHVTKVEVGTSVTTITLDTSIGTAGETATVEFNNWKQDPTTYTSDNGEYKKYGGFGVNTWIQFKVILNGDIEMREFISKGNSKAEL